MGFKKKSSFFAKNEDFLFGLDLRLFHFFKIDIDHFRIASTRVTRSFWFSFGAFRVRIHFFASCLEGSVKLFNARFASIYILRNVRCLE